MLAPQDGQSDCLHSAYAHGVERADPQPRGNAEPGDRGRPRRRCPNCANDGLAVASIYEHVDVMQGPGGAISTHTEDHLEYRCARCGTRLGFSRAVAIVDEPPL